MVTKSGNRLSEKDMAKVLVYQAIQAALEGVSSDLRDRVKVMTDGQLEKVRKYVEEFQDRFAKVLIKGGKVDAIKDELGL